MALLGDPSTWDVTGGLLGPLFGVVPSDPRDPDLLRKIQAGTATQADLAGASPGLLEKIQAGTAGPDDFQNTYSKSDRMAALGGLMNAGLATWAASAPGQAHRPALGAVLYAGLQAGQQAAMVRQKEQSDLQTADLARRGKEVELSRQASLMRIMASMAKGDTGAAAAVTTTA